MTREKAIEVLDAALKERSDGYYSHLVHCGKQDKAEEEFLDSLDMAIAALREQHRWISVEERLPEGGGSVLIYSPFGGVAEGTYSEHYKRWVQYRWSVFEPEVTHWMPLPEPPTEVEV